MSNITELILLPLAESPDKDDESSYIVENIINTW